MLKSQAKALNDTGLALLDQAATVSKAGEIKNYTELGLKCLEESRKILEGMKSNSILIYLECSAHVGASPSGQYGSYLDFCARNGLEILSEIDFNAVCGSLAG